MLGLTLLLAATLGASSAQAFGTVWGILGQRSEHERVTRLALQCGAGVQPPDCFQPSSLDNLAGKRGTFGAVGAPDDIPIHLRVDREYWHCDNADYADPRTYGLGAAYPQSRQVALEKLAQCIAWGRAKLYDGGKGQWSLPPATPSTGAVATAAQLIKANGKVDDSDPGVSIFSPSCTYNGVETRRAKCNVMEPFGYVLHMTEDFYAHTNWSDLANPALPISLGNPIGLGRTGTAPFLNLELRSFDPARVPLDFTGGCYPKKLCRGRIIHGESATDQGLNKDRELINTTTGQVTDPRTPRGRVVVHGVSNAQRAVDGAVKEARRQWAVFRNALVTRYGSDRGARMVCALVLDRSETCDTRRMVVVVDTDAAERVDTADAGHAAAATTEDAASIATPADAAGQALLERLAPTDRVAVVDFDDATGRERISPFAAPDAVSVDPADDTSSAPDPTVTDDGRSDAPDPTVTPKPDPASDGPRTKGDFTPEGSGGGGDTGEADGPPTATGTAAAAAAAAPGGEAKAAATALGNAGALLDDANAPRGEQGVALITDRLGSVEDLVESIDALHRRGIVVSLGFAGGESVPARVVAAVNATGGTVLASRSAATLQTFAAVADSSGLTRLDDAFPNRGATLVPGAPTTLGTTGSEQELHQVARLPRAARLRVRALDGPLTVFVTDEATGRRQRVSAKAGATTTVTLAAGGDDEVRIAGPAGRRYAVSLVAAR